MVPLHFRKGVITESLPDDVVVEFPWRAGRLSVAAGPYQSVDR
jgi:hypothetical protein